MIQLPFNLKDSNDTLQTQYYTHYATQITVKPITEIPLRTGEITKIEFLDTQGKWIEPTEVIAHDDRMSPGKLIYPGYPYGFKHSHSGTGDEDNVWINICYGPQGIEFPYWGGMGFFNVQNTNGKAGIRLWSGNNIIVTRRYYSESYSVDPNPTGTNNYTSIGMNNRWIDAYLRSKIKYFTR